MKPLLAILAAALLTGCGTLSRPIFRPVLGTNVIAARVESRTTLATNLVPVSRTNSAGAVELLIATNVVATVTPFAIPSTYTVVTNGWEQRPGIDTGVQVASGAVNLVAPGVGSIVSYAASGILALWGAYLNRKAKTATETATGLVKGVEDFRQAVLLTPLGPKLSRHLVDQIQVHLPAATAAGLLLEKLVDEHTGNTNGPAEFMKSLI